MKDGKFVRYYSDGSINGSGEFINEKHNMAHINDPWLNQWFQENI